MVIEREREPRVRGVGLVTLGGGLFGAAGVAAIVNGNTAFAVIALIVSLVVDMLDGWLARRYWIDTDAGAFWDWTVDVSVGAAIGALVLGPWWLALQLVAQFAAVYFWRRHRVSGRAVTTLVVVVVLGAQAGWWL